jgi:hypothetical protein
MIARIAERLEAHPEVWRFGEATKPNKFACFEDSAQHIVLQYPVSLRSHTRSQFHLLWESWSDAVQPVIDHVVEHYEYPGGCTSRIMLARLLGGAEIGAHTDSAPAARVPHKIHVPILTAPEIDFIAEGSHYHLELGSAYEVNNRVLHGGINRSSVDRVHLIFDYFDGAAHETNSPTIAAA